MRLSKIKLAGFKTFVDPTVLSFPSNLIGIIGPNGCGKSNIIDAIRWVMGESSARNLRGESMDDVIFSGSSSRPEVSKAFIELYFDNENNTLDSKFARFNEIVIRREVSRDGTSNYYLNNTRCRRKDIREVFLGTGLGPRSYAIIEQGMISRLVESKPEELRTYLEEAAGISKYKEKRRETELRLKHTKDNLNRLNDVMKEISSQLNKLERQAKAANDYKELKDTEKGLKLNLLSQKWNNFNLEIIELDKNISKSNIEHEKQKSLVTNKDKLIEETRVDRNKKQEIFNNAQADFYHIGSEIAKCEKDIEHSQESEFSRQKLIDEIISNIENFKKEQEKERSRINNLDNIVKDKQKMLSNVTEELSVLNKEKTESNFALQNWQTIYNDFISAQSETKNKQEIENTKINASEKSIELLTKRLKILESYTIDDDQNQSDKNIIIGTANDIQQKVSSILIDIERSSSFNQGDDKLFKILPSSIKYISENLKNLIKKIKILIRSQDDEISDVKSKINDYQSSIKKAKESLENLHLAVRSNDEKKIKLEKERIEFKQIIDKGIWKLEELQKSQNDLNISISSLLSEKAAAQENYTRIKRERTDLEDRKLILLSNDSTPAKPSSDMQNLLKKLLDDKKSQEINLSGIRDSLALLDKKTSGFESDKNDINIIISDLREKLEIMKISLSEKTAQRNSLKENSDMPVSEIENALNQTSSSDSIESIDKEINAIQSKINNLGAINLAAIDELKDQKERKTYLDNQYDDLSKSVMTLENAIKTIDNETKVKFKDIFDQINNNLNSFFGKIFGGGKAHLEMTDNDLLNTGVSIMARPPGKLIKNINLLSGGEKAGVGIAFVFSIFKINPAPFCLLDEVDAPLDEANNTRFCNVVREMSETVQFIFITHNKSTMELADILSGVTMREPGVSKLVSVNVGEAVDMTANKKTLSGNLNQPN
ncbi:MAG: AAA family ATPase [Gammaproteobacteria bacterium]|jgi:chromosome segregation ATPase|nr:AAA family ATPase [Gammaproteobacteria bacterium]MBT4461916.1 AAA family ATPase [Gammaproteobacteria bacterium]MBT4654305.1 AAA family ATPase [Gammaproteobacteria bacterium]MBT5116912.1 AAA family ATPase [Gammaproteobacteria bacterium]MBT5761210.1 AAA family ATPase [Gammaproteobacteria bacterium]